MSLAANDDLRPVLIPISHVKSRLRKRIVALTEHRDSLPFWRLNAKAILTGAIVALKEELGDITALEINAHFIGENIIP